MKKLIILLSIICFAFASHAQDKTVKVDGVFNVKGNVTDTIIKDGTSTYNLYIKDFANETAIQGTLVRTSGTYTKGTLVTSGSYDNVEFFPIDTITYGSAAATVKGNSGTLTAKYPYITYTLTLIDSVQTVKPTFTILIDKN